MTNEVPDIIVDLPTYEQVEDVKDVVVNTGGMLVDVDDKKYKAVMHNIFSTKDFVGSDIMQSLDNDFKEKYPLIAKDIGTISKYARTHLFDDIHVVMLPAYLTVVFLDMKTLTVIKAQRIIHTDYVYMNEKAANNFIDSKYIYLRGRSNSNSLLSFAVFDKNTFEFVTAIKADKNVGYLLEEYIPGEIVLQGDILIMSSALANNMLFVFKLAYSAGGVPISLLFDSQASFGSGGGNPPRLVFGDSEYVYVCYEVTFGNVTIDKKRYNKTTKLFENIATNITPNSYISGTCIWCFKYVVNGTRYIIANMLSRGIMVLNIDTISTHQHVSNSPKSTNPLFDYINGNHLALKPSTSLYVELGGRPFDLYFESKLIGDTWVTYPQYAITLRIIGPTAGEMFPKELLYLDQRAIISNGVLYGYRSSQFSGIPQGTFKLDNISILNYYKEVL